MARTFFAFIKRVVDFDIDRSDVVTERTQPVSE
jgi:hypothetical protein